mgnify:CR=1 FL=1
MAIKVANNQSLTAITALPSAVSGGAMTLLSTETASSSATISFTSNIDSTYKEYIFTYNNVHPSVDAAKFLFQGNASGGSGYNETITSTFFYGYHAEADDEAGMAYYGGGDQAQGTAFQRLGSGGVGTDNDQSASGYLHLFDPSDTTFVTHFIATNSTLQNSDDVNHNFIAGYFNTTSAIDEIQFKFDSGNIDSGVIKLYGIS